MARKLTMGINWQGKLDLKALIERVKIADDAGIDSMWVAEAWGHDAFTLLALLAEHTKRIKLGTSIVNIYSRTPAALAQHFGTLDELSGGRMIIGLGTSGPQVIEHFHGIKFNPPLTRMKEYVDIINMIMAGTPLNYNGKLFKLGARIHDTLRAGAQAHSDFHCVAQSEERRVHRAEGRWMAAGDDSGVGPWAGRFRNSRPSRKPPAAIPNRSRSRRLAASSITKNAERTKAGQAGTIAFYAARMGTFYSEQLTRFGFGDEVRTIKQAWDSGGSKAGTEAVSPKMLSQLGYAGDVQGRTRADHRA